VFCVLQRFCLRSQAPVIGGTGAQEGHGGGQARSLLDLVSKCLKANKRRGIQKPPK
jgi:hypothetical protein